MLSVEVGSSARRRSIRRERSRENGSGEQHRPSRRARRRVAGVPPDDPAGVRPQRAWREGRPGLARGAVPALAITLVHHRADGDHRRTRLVPGPGRARPQAAVLRAGGRDRHPRGELRAADAPGRRGRHRGGGRSGGRRPVRADLRQRGLAAGRGDRAGHVDRHPARRRATDDHPVRGAGRDHRGVGADHGVRLRPLAGRRDRCRSGPADGDHRTECAPSQTPGAGGRGARRHGRHPGGGVPRDAGRRPGRRRRGAGPLATRRGGAEPVLDGRVRGAGRGPTVAVPARRVAKCDGVRRPVRPAGPCQPESPGAGPPMRRLDLARREGARSPIWT